MNSALRRTVVCFAALLACAMIPRTGHAQSPSPGVFSELQTELVPGIGAAFEPATMRSRVVQVDMPRIAAARLGRETLRLNLFDDAIVEVRIERIRPTRSGFFISGRPVGMEWGEVRLVVNGPIVVGTVVTPEGKFTIRWDGSGRHVIRQIDPSAERIEHELEGDPLSTRPPQASLSIDPLASITGPATDLAEEAPTEDGSEVRVLVVYTPAMQTRQGGTGGVEALIDLMIHSANQAFEISGINPRLMLAHTALVNYVGERSGTDLDRLINPDDGYMDEVHALRNEHAADLVHLLTATTSGPAGTAGRIHSESLIFENKAAFAVTATGWEETFTHETGHNFGLRHDRFVNSLQTAIYPYAFGYANNRAFEPGAPVTARWRTIMAYRDRCSDAGFGCPRLLRFSNPDQTHGGDPLGVPADDPATGPGGPADARLTINRSARWAGSFRSEACTAFTISPETPVASVDGGEVVLKVETAPGCLWEASSQSAFLTPASDARRSGPRFLSINVEANQTDAQRIGTLTVADKTIEVRQFAGDEGICSRTTTVMDAITKAAGYTGAAQCDEVTDNDLAGIVRLSLVRQGVGSLKAGDFKDLSQLTNLGLSGNELTTLPEGLFAGLSSLKDLYLSNNRLTDLPENLFAGLSSLEALGLENNQLTDLPDGLFAGLSSLRNLDLEGNDLTHLSQDHFADLANLEELVLFANKLSTLPDGLFADLLKLVYLNLGDNLFATLPSQLFAGLADLERLIFYVGQLTSLPEDIFAGLSSLTLLDLRNNEIAEFPPGLFAGLSSLNSLTISSNQLTTLPNGVFSGLTALGELDLFLNHLSSLPPGVFAGLTALEVLGLYGNQLNSLPSEVFIGLSALRELNLGRNQLSSLPDGIFSGLTSLETLVLARNRVDPLPLRLTLAKVGDDQFKAVTPSGAPFALPIPVSSNGGTIEPNASTVTIPVGAVESSPLRVARVADTQQRVSVDIGMLPDLPDTHSGYVLEKDEALPLSVLPSIDPADAALSGLSLSDGTLDPVFATDTTRYKASVAHAVSSTTVTLATSNASAAAAFHDESDAALPDADASADGHQVSLNEGENVIKLEVTAENGTSTRTYTIVMTREDSNCDRTEEVLAAIMAAVSGIDTCGYLSNAHLAEIAILDLNGRRISSLKSGDFAGLSALKTLYLYDNQLTALPGDVFSGLAALESLGLWNNQLESLPDNVFSGLSALRQINLSSNRLSRLPDGVFSGLLLLEDLWLSYNPITSLPANAFSGLSSLISLSLDGNELTNLPAGVFSGLAGLRGLYLTDNALTSLPPDVFSGLSSLSTLLLSSNGLTNLPADVFSGLPALQTLLLQNNALTSLPPNVFSGLSALQRLVLSANQLTTLPDGLFVDLTSLRDVDLRGNTVDPLPLSVSLEKAGEGRFKAVVPAGAPFVLGIPVSTGGSGTIEGDVSQVTIPIGAVESASIGVSRVPGGSETATVDIGMLPPLPGDHYGYVLEKDTTLPIEIPLPEVVPPPDQVAGVEVTAGGEQLDVIWTAVADADGYKVQWKSAGEDYDEARQAVISGGDAVSYTITGLTAGTQYTVRVIATQENTDDGPASDEVTGIPQAMSLGQVTGLEVRARMNQLRVSWTAVADADGYKVQWKSGEEDYDEARQAAVAGGDTTTYVITGLTAGTEHSVRVIATGENADDGPASGEVTATPRSADPDVNGDGALDGNDALMMYYAYRYASLVGDGETGGTAESRQRFLAGYSGKTDPSDEELRAMLRKANTWRAAGVNEGGDINDDGVIDGSDAYAMYYAYAFESLLGNGDEGGTARFRSLLLGPLAGQPDPTDENLKEMLRRANRLREEFS